MKFKKLHPDAITPTYATDGAACIDLYASHEAIVQAPTAIGTGIAFEVPEGYAMLVFSRSGHGFKDGIRLANCVGVIDSDYRGEVAIKLHNDAWIAKHIAKGDRIAQAMLVPVPRIELEEVAVLGDTARGTGGFGSTGA